MILISPLGFPLGQFPLFLGPLSSLLPLLSLLLVFYRDSRLRLSVLGADPASPGAFLDVLRHSQAQPIPGVLVVRPEGPMFFWAPA